MLIDTFINAIFLYDDKIIITFNYKDSGKTIELADISGSDIDLDGAPPRDSTNDRMISICCWVSCLFGVSKSVDISRDLALLHFLFLRHLELKIASQNQFRVSFRKYVKKPISNSFALPGGVHFPLK